MFFCWSLTWLPPDMIKTASVPIVKIKHGNNYRPVAFVTIISKLLVFESVLRLKWEDYLSTSSN